MTEQKAVSKKFYPKTYRMNLSDRLIGGIARAFWRRIEPYKNKYGPELPDDMPVEFVAHMGTALVMLDRFPPTLEIELGHGDKIVTDIYDPEGQWAGIAISNGDCPVGEFIETGAKTVGDLEPLLTITTANPKSLKVVIQACERAIEKLKDIELRKSIEQDAKNIR
jgi:hypothetical protein